jgi:site-specific recombinase XerD
MPVSFLNFRFRSHAAARLLRDYLDFKYKLGHTSFGHSHGPARDAVHFDNFVSEMAIADIKQLDEAALSNWVYGPPVSSEYAKNKRISFLRGFYVYLVRRKLVPYNLGYRLPFIKTPPYKPYIYSLLEIHQILQETAKFSEPIGPSLKTLFFLIYACGLRLGEPLALKIKDVDFDESTLSLWNTKFHKERLVPFSPAVAKVLKEHLRYCHEQDTKLNPADRFFSLLKHRGRLSMVQHYFRKIRERLNLPKKTRIHDLRHSFAVHRLYKWYQEGAHPMNKLPMLSRYMGHASVHHTQVYLTITLSLLREGENRFETAFGKIGQSSLRRALRRL